MPYSGKIVFVLFAAALFCSCGGSEHDTQWIDFGEVKLSGNKSALSYTPDALKGALEIPLPDINRISGRGKLLDHGSETIPIGYEIEVDIDSLNTDSIPSKYRSEHHLSDRITLPAVDEVRYRVRFSFVLQDKDGFRIDDISSTEHVVVSGQVNQIRDRTDSGISLSDASVVEDIRLAMVIEECISCRNDGS